MKVALVAPDWGNSWKPSLKAAFERSGHEVRWLSEASEFWVVFDWCDICISMWADDMAGYLSHEFKGKFYTYIRAYEVFTDMPANINWDNVKGLFFCNRNTMQIANHKFPQISKFKPYVIPNWIDVDRYKCEKRMAGSNIAMVCDFNFKKNIPLALQVISEIPDRYSLHIVGECQEESLALYMENIVADAGLQDRVKVYNRIPHEAIPEFLEDKYFILSTSMREGCPMNILEAMAMGLKPIIHNWPGAKDIFPKDLVFNKISEVQSILEGPYDSNRYRSFVEENHNIDNAEKIVDIINEPINTILETAA